MPYFYQRALLHARSVIAAEFLFRKYRNMTMIGRRDFWLNVVTARDILRNRDLDGASIVECGTWRGGMSATLMEICGPNRDYFFFDSFEGLPDAKEIDGAEAIAFKSKPNNFDNCTASLDEFKKTISRVPHQHRAHIIKGFFENTVPDFSPPSIALLRLDGDWYDSTMICLDRFWDHVLPGGGILIDDYYTWEGCSKAVHDFLSRRKASERIRHRYGTLAYIVKN